MTKRIKLTEFGAKKFYEMAAEMGATIEDGAHFVNRSHVYEVVNGEKTLVDTVVHKCNCNDALEITDNLYNENKDLQDSVLAGIFEEV